jgi:hypothetical protein
MPVALFPDLRANARRVRDRRTSVSRPVVKIRLSPPQSVQLSAFRRSSPRDERISAQADSETYRSALRTAPRAGLTSPALS